MNLESKEIDEVKQGEVLEMEKSSSSNSKKLYLESYGCAMNFADSEIVASILSKDGFSTTKDASVADVVLINTCSIRENAEQKVRTRINQLKQGKKQRPGMVIGVLGCMAERLKTKILEEEKLVDLVAGPDAYKDLPNLIQEVEGGQKAVNVLLSREETYADINPVRLDSNGVTAFVSIMRGCDNMCSFCVVPFTRGRERSRDPKSIVHETKYLLEQGYKEVTLLGQNVDSYRWNIDKKGNVVDPELEVVNFARLLEMVAKVSPEMRVRFSTSHPKDMTDEVLETIAKYDNICNYVHLPVQSGNSAVLKRMNRGYSREWYLDRIAAINRIIPNPGISTDFITGFCGETDEEHAETISLMQEVQFGFAYMYTYSERPKTLAERKFEDDVPEKVKSARLTEIVALQREHSMLRNKEFIGQVCEVLVEKISKKSDEEYCGRNSQNAMVVFPKENSKIGSYVNVLIEDCTSATLRGKIVL